MSLKLSDENWADNFKTVVNKMPLEFFIQEMRRSMKIRCDSIYGDIYPNELRPYAEMIIEFANIILNDKAMSELDIEKFGRDKKAVQNAK